MYVVDDVVLRAEHLVRSDREDPALFPFEEVDLVLLRHFVADAREFVVAPNGEGLKERRGELLGPFTQGELGDGNEAKVIENKARLAAVDNADLVASLADRSTQGLVRYSNVDLAVAVAEIELAPPVAGPRHKRTHDQQRNGEDSGASHCASGILLGLVLWSRQTWI